MFDLTLYWDMLSKDSHDGGGGVNVVDKMEDCVRQSRDSQFPAHEQIALLISGGDLLQRLRLYDISMTYYRRACELEDREIGLAAISKIEYMPRRRAYSCGRATFKRRDACMIER